MELLIRTLLSLVIALSFLGTFGCEEGRASSDGTSSKGKKPRIVTTVAMVGNVAAAIAGDDAEVITLIGTGVDPHLYRPTRDDVRQLHSADIVLYSGYHLEGKMAEMLHELAKTKPSVAVAEVAKLGVRADEAADSYDPHVWMDPQLWQATADVVAATLSEKLPERKAVFDERAAAFKQQCVALREYGEEIMQTVPAERRVLVTSHDAFRYFRTAFGVRELSLQGISTESEASLKKINDVANEVVRLKVPAVFIESSVPSKSVQALIDACASQGHTVVIGGELFSDAMGASGTYEGTYIGMIDHNLTTVVRALGGTAPERGLNGKLTPHAISH